MKTVTIPYEIAEQLIRYLEAGIPTTTYGKLGYRCEYSALNLKSHLEDALLDTMVPEGDLLAANYIYLITE